MPTSPLFSIVLPSTISPDVLLALIPGPSFPSSVLSGQDAYLVALDQITGRSTVRINVDPNALVPTITLPAPRVPPTVARDSAMISIPFQHALDVIAQSGHGDGPARDVVHRRHSR